MTENNKYEKYKQYFELTQALIDEISNRYCDMEDFITMVGSQPEVTVCPEFRRRMDDTLEAYNLIDELKE